MKSNQKNTIPVEILNDSCDSFKKSHYKARKPVVLRGLDIGECKEKWNVEYLSQVFGKMPVKIHVSPVPEMDFIKKNFQYKTLGFDEFLRKVSNNEHDDYFLTSNEKYYLRSLGEDPRKNIADIHKQFPSLAEDFKIPSVFDKENFFSSVFRISSADVQLWTHYDIMDNVLVHISGHKKVVLFPPTDALNLYLVGDKSQVMNIDDPDFGEFPKFKDVERYECLLEPGDVLFIPALWFHNVTALDFAISVNVFWKHLSYEIYDQMDVYGNKDLVPAQRAMQGVEKALKSLSTLPEEYRDFFARRLIAKIESTLLS